MSRVLRVAGREFMENVRTRGFWISLLAVPVILLISLSIPLVAESSKPALTFAVTDHSGWLLGAVMEDAARDDIARLLSRATSTPGLRQRLQDRGLGELVERWQAAAPDARRALLDTLAGNGDETDPITLAFRSWWLTLEPDELARLVPTASRARLRLVHGAETWIPPRRGAAWLAEDRVFAHIVIPEDPVGRPRRPAEPVRYSSRNLTNTDLRDWFVDRASEQVRAQRLAESGTDPAQFRWLEAEIEIDHRTLAADGAERDSSTQDVLRQWAPVAFVYVLWISVFTVTQMLLTSTIEEKSNKLVEVLLATITPVQLMAGKIVGIASTGAVIIGSWMASFLGATLLLPVLLGATPALDLSALAADPAYLGSFALYFVLGYLFYAALLCGVGSVCNTLKEAQTLIIPVQMVLFVPLVLMIPIARDPGGMIAAVLTWIPPFTPFVMMNRAAMPPGALVYLGTTLLMLLSIAAALWAAARIFRIGILMTGQPPSVREMLRWLRAAPGADPAPPRDPAG